jgi:hypothetical protein
MIGLAIGDRGAIMDEIIIDGTGKDDDHVAFRVRVVDNTDRTVHDVSLSHRDYERFGLLSGSPERFVERCFECLLRRGPKESIPSQFDIGAIARELPNFLEELRLCMLADLRSTVPITSRRSAQ